MRSRRSRLRRVRLRCFAGFLLLLLLLVGQRAAAHVTCTPGDHALCASLLRPGSMCSAQGICTNPYQGGCLRARLPADYQNVLRTCNSDDDSRDSTQCRPSAMNYPEIRILSQNWETPVLAAWILQILLSELLNVPVTIETSSPDREASFYHPLNAFDYSLIGYDYEALRTAHRVKDCRLTTLPCGHVVPEVWNGQIRTIRAIAQTEGVIEVPVGSGAVGRFGWFLPRYAAEQDSSLLEYLGITGVENRAKVAETFGQPTRWGDYCQQVSPDECATPTAVAGRPPRTLAEESRFFVDGSYQGHFQFTAENNCTDNLATCTGHITDVSCEWSTFVVSQAYYHDINVKSNGSLSPNNGYTYGEMTDIYFAANATRSPVLFYWWTPESLFQRFLGTDAELMHVQLRPPKQSCVEHRVLPEDRCSDDFLSQVGAEVGSCDCEAHSLLKLVVSSLGEELISQTPVQRSPAYNAIKGLTLSELQLGEMLDNWYSRKVDPTHFDPREAACQWAAENIDFLQLFVPPTYPRVIENREWAPVWNFAVMLACASTLLVLITAAMIHTYQERPPILYAQKVFLFLVLAGLLLTSVGALISSTTSPSCLSCTVANWLLVLGYTLSVVPLIVKIAALNRLLHAARQLRRLRMNQRRLYQIVGGVLSVAVVFLVLRTVLDPVTRQDQMDLTLSVTDAGETIISQSRYCDSKSVSWEYVELGWYSVLLLIASVLAFQSRDVRQEFNETQTLVFLIYSKFLFAVLQLMTLFLKSSLSPQLTFGYRSLIQALDALVSLVVYFLPKLYQAVTNKPMPATTFFRPSALASHKETDSTKNVIQSAIETCHRPEDPTDVREVSVDGDIITTGLTSERYTDGEEGSAGADEEGSVSDRYTDEEKVISPTES